jgi:superfamily II DNA or RNA helicase
LSSFDPFDRFQREAVACIVHDFVQNRAGRYLLVIPTGGGKTFTAVKSINRLFREGVLDHERDRVAWVAHRTELLDQACDTFDSFVKQNPDHASCKENIDFLMLSKVRGYFRDAQNARLAVIDEAHHGAANSYQPIFERQDVGILGLTATPTRHDGRPLEFERESYSIGFPDLVRMGVVLNPSVVKVEGGSYSISSIDKDDDLEKLNNKIRNGKIIDALLTGHKEYKKAVIYVGTRKHVIDLYQAMSSSQLLEKYDSISWITGDGNSRSQDRTEFLEQERKHERSIIINVDILSEGYDDPSINTVVMAAPTRSKLRYMQAIGRAIRRNPEDELKHCYIIEIEDELPNIRYRIDNRWLYSDVSDALEPAVSDLEYRTEEEYRQSVSRIWQQYNVLPEHQITPQYEQHDRYSMLLFKVYRRPGEYCHFPILISNANRTRVSNMFNFLSERMPSYVNQQINSAAAFRMVNVQGIAGLENSGCRRHVFDAMWNSALEDPTTNAARPWITFVSFNVKRSEDRLAQDLLDFVQDMINRDEIVERLITNAYEEGSVLIKLPLPLASFVGKIVPKVDFEVIHEVVRNLTEIKNKHGTVDHRLEVESILSHTVIPLEAIYHQGLATVAREEIDFSRHLN